MQDKVGNPTATIYPLRAVDRICDVLDVLQRSDVGVHLTALAGAVDLPKSSAFRYLTALESRKYVERDSTGAYRLGLAFRPERSQYVTALRVAALPYLIAMRDRFDETVNLGILDGAEVVHIEVAESTQPVRLAAHRGQRADLHCTAIGKAVATVLTETRIRQVLDESGMPAITHDTITSVDAFLAEIKLTSERGYGFDDCENQGDGRCLAVLIDGLEIPTAVSVSAPASRFAAEDAGRIAHQLRKQLPELARALHAVPR